MNLGDHSELQHYSRLFPVRPGSCQNITAASFELASPCTGLRQQCCSDAPCCMCTFTLQRLHIGMCRKHELEENMLMNLQKKTWTHGLTLKYALTSCFFGCLLPGSFESAYAELTHLVLVCEPDPLRASVLQQVIHGQATGQICICAFVASMHCPRKANSVTSSWFVLEVIPQMLWKRSDDLVA